MDPQLSFIDQKIRHYGGGWRHGINRYVGRHSKIGDPAIFDPDSFDWPKTIAPHWEEIREEARAVMAKGELPSIVELSPDHEGINADRGWRSFFLWGYGMRVDSNCAMCPKTTQLVEQIPGLLTAMYSVHRPGTHLKLHRGVTKGMVTAHLPLSTPKDAAQCRIQVEDTTTIWKEGEFFIFDDTREHEVWNDTDEPRVNLMLHFRRPLVFPGSALQWLFFTILRHTAFVKDSEERVLAWSKRFADLDETVERETDSAAAS